MAIEKKRGCGYRKVGGLYLVGGGITMPCDRLPFVIKECECCGFKPPMFRGFSWINKKYLGKDHSVMLECNCFSLCPICHPGYYEEDKFGFMWVSHVYYTPASFIQEAKELEVSKRISYIPKDLKIGDWVLLAYKPKKKDPEKDPYIFYAFKVQRIEKLIWESQATEDALKKLKDKDLTPVIVPDGDKDHA